MITINSASMSCGVKLLGGETLYSSVEAWINDFIRLNYEVNADPKPPIKSEKWLQKNPATYTQFIFSHSPTKSKMGKAITEYIEKHGLGSVLVSEPGNNPVHSSKIVVYVWTRDNKAFEKHAKELLLPKDKTEDVPKPEVV